MLKYNNAEHGAGDDFTTPRLEDDESLSAWGQLMRVTTAATKAPRPRGERRMHQRVIFSVPLKLYHLMPGGISSARGISLDLSESGVAALVQMDLMIGEAVEIDMQLPTSSLCAVAIVRYYTKTRSGFEFVGLSPQERSQISAALGKKA